MDEVSDEIFSMCHLGFLVGVHKYNECRLGDQGFLTNAAQYVAGALGAKVIAPTGTLTLT